MLLRLCQLTAHIFLVQEMIEDCFQLEDIENLWRKTESESSPENKSGRDMLLIMRKVIADSKSIPQDETPTENEVCRETESLPENESSTTEPNLSHDTVDQDQPKQSPQLIFKFRKYLRDLAKGSRWSDIKDRSLCHKCRDVPDEPWLTECLHVYCKECLMTMSYEAALKGERGALCQECGELFGESSPCTGVQELELNDDSNSIAPRKASQSRKDKDTDIRWIGLDGRVLPSSKTAAVQAQVEKWLIDEPDKKIIIFSQFYML